ncbi:MAG: toprim domain-containing protein [Clostridia bacterium]|nr:toprim domain-containing protein [Clostridia bacterium]
MIDISQIKSLISCVEFAQQNNIPIRYSGDRCVSPFRSGAKNKTSFWCFDDHWTDFGSGQSGDVIDFAAYLLYDGDKGKAIRELAKLTGVEISAPVTQEWIDYTQNLCQKIQYYHERLTDDDRTYLHKRGITDETINRVKIGRTNNGRLSFPYWKNGYICYYATRSMPGGAYPDSKYRKMPIDSFNDHTIWGLHTINREPERNLLIIAEGAFDALSFDQENYAVISAITGFFSKDQLPTALGIAKSFKQVFLVYDNDPDTKAGEKFTEKMARILTENRIPCLIGTVPFPHKYKDVSDYYADGNSLTDLIDNAVDGISFLADKITDTKDFEKYARKVCRFMSAPQVDTFFETIALSEKFSCSFLKTLLKECKKAPNDMFIADEVLKKHKLLYNPKISFFEYNGKYWERKTNEGIENYIREELGPYVTGPRLSSILRVIKASVVTEQLFNMKPIFNLINGAIEIIEEEPFYIFREHRENDYCTYCLSYPYVPGVVSQDWNAFIESVTDNDEKRQAFLQEFAGYILYPDNRMHKCAALIGEGANGKSIYFNTLANLFGKQNVSRITITNLSQDFQAINLLGSLLNISSENKTEFYGAEETFKQVVSGDDISACYKGKDYITFKPRAKMIISLNNMPKSNDKSNGLLRRFAFVEFPLTFVETPKKPNERLLDRSLETKFAENSHLTGIFNWVLDGYIMVRRCGYITETREHIEQLNVFKEESDHVITFVKQVEVERRYTNSEFYEVYKFWCVDNGFKPVNSRAFHMSVSKYIKDYRQDIEQYRTKKSRGYQLIGDKVTTW